MQAEVKEECSYIEDCGDQTEYTPASREFIRKPVNSDRIPGCLYIHSRVFTDVVHYSLL